MTIGQARDNLSVIVASLQNGVLVEYYIKNSNTSVAQIMAAKLTTVVVKTLGVVFP